jgi:Lon protease-like protein
MAEIPLFPVPLVLFPGGRLPLQILETRYLDMLTACLRNNTGFGVVMIREGSQMLAHRDEQLPSVAFTGTLATIVDFDEGPNGMLDILIQGQCKFAVRDQYEQADRLMLAQVEYLPDEAFVKVPEDKLHLASLLQSLIEHEAVQGLELAVDFESATDVGGRLTELLPLPNQFKQRMLEMKNPIARLADLETLIERMQDSG